MCFAKVMYITSILDNFNRSKKLDFYCICTSFVGEQAFPDSKGVFFSSKCILYETAIRICIKKRCEKRFFDFSHLNLDSIILFIYLQSGPLIIYDARWLRAIMPDSLNSLHFCFVPHHVPSSILFLFRTDSRMLSPTGSITNGSSTCFPSRISSSICAAASPF